MEQGTVIRFNPDKHYGFIDPDYGSEHVMLHERELCDRQDASRLDRGVRVSYEVRRTERGLRASDVRVLANGHAPGGRFRDEIAEVLEAAVGQIAEIARRYGIAD